MAHKLNIAPRGQPCGKSRHHSEAAAQGLLAALASWEKIHGAPALNLGPLRVYWCDRCHAWHVGHVDGHKMFGGTQGRSFIVSGMLVGSSMPELHAAEGRLLSYADGLTHTLVDNRGRTWPNVIFRGEYVDSPSGPRPLAGGGWCLPYRLVMEQIGPHVA